ncbi:DUF4955 domain-containing protein [Pontiella sulfatireligans]|uniref:Pectate lyase superfamily protein domain-containing protein n=1 Tax=Pontiella sulfatireligans TaxID=2750658 RepID=A0A6C2UE20_9BACT|nr:DUF4955 domain-containing protein [Pontiella sulfatireligans]VGO18149.1 hypothetical protein SCARR_00200 [Pontiella sulfatireligans]
MKRIVCSIWVMLGAVCFAEEQIAPSSYTSSLWKQYHEAKLNGGEPELADFSYVGYRHGAEPIPTVEWKVFNVMRAGAKPNDSKSDRKAFLLAIEAAEKHGSGIIYFPAGRYLLNEQDDPHNEPIVINGSKIVLRGAGCGEGGTELFFDRHMDPVHPDKLWTCPYIIQFKGEKPAGTKAKVVADARRETFAVEVSDASAFKAGGWIELSMTDTSPAGVAAAVAPYPVQPAWKTIINRGFVIDELHQVAAVDGNVITFNEPIHIDVNAVKKWTVQKWAPLEEVGVEDIAFVGNWHEKFVHHKNAIHDGGWSIVQLSRCVNSWARNCRFIDVNRVVAVGGSAAVTVEDLSLEGNRGHNAVSLHGTSHCLIRRINDTASHWHAGGVAGACSGNVFQHCAYPEDTCYEAHASQPRWTLFDNVTGGWMYGRWGGAEQNQPNHLHGLVFWNYEKIGLGEPGAFHFMRSDSKYGRTIMPCVIGFHGVPQAWAEEEIKVLESNGAPVWPDSLYDAQFELRMTK